MNSCQWFSARRNDVLASAHISIAVKEQRSELSEHVNATGWDRITSNFCVLISGTMHPERTSI